jgi:hypothetical protein
MIIELLALPIGTIEGQSFHAVKVVQRTVFGELLELIVVFYRRASSAVH